VPGAFRFQKLAVTSLSSKFLDKEQKMKNSKKQSLGILSGLAIAILLVFCFAFLGCPQEWEEEQGPPENAQAPIIKTQPVGGYTAFRGEEEAQEPLTVVAEVKDGGQLSYQWWGGYTEDDLAALPSGLGASYTPIFGHDETSPAFFKVVITNTNTKATKDQTASVESNIVSITLANREDAAAPVITTQPVNAGYNLGDIITPLAVVVEQPESGSLSYQWYENEDNSNEGGLLIPDATNASFAPVIDEAGFHYYYVVVTNTDPGATGAPSTSTVSDPVTITMTGEDAPFPTITSSPVSADYLKDAAIASLTVTATVSGSGMLSYQWYSNTVASASGGQQLAGQTSDNYQPTVSATPGTYYYYVIVTNTDSSATGAQSASIPSSVATIRVYPYDATPAPVISGQPANGEFAQNQVTMTVTATHSAVSSGAVLSYQWYESSTEQGTGALIGGATSATFAPTTLQIGSTIYFYCVVTVNDPNAKTTKTATVISNRISIKVLPAASNIVTVNTSTKYQYVRGFGAMSGVSFRAGIGSASPDMTVADMEKMFNPTTGLGFNMLRICLYDDIRKFMNNEEGFKANNRTVDESDYADIIKVVNNYNGYAFAVPWTPPAAYKTNNSLVGGGSVKTAEYANLATYFFKDFVDHMASLGAPVFGFCIQNEYDFTSQYEGCEYSPTQMRDFIKVLGPIIANTPGYGGGRAWDKVFVVLGDTMGTFTEPNTTLNDADAEQYVDAVGHHLYEAPGGKYNLAFTKGKEVWQTEHADTTGRSGTGTTMYTNMSSWNWVWHIMNEVDYCMRLLDDSVFTMWYGKRFYGAIGDGEYGTTEGQIMNRGYAMSHFSKFAANTNRVAVTTSGATMNPTTWTNGNIDSSSQNSDVPKVTAYESLDGNSVVVIIFTPVKVTGSGANPTSPGTNLGYVKIQLPAGFAANTVKAMRSNLDIKAQDDSAGVILSNDKNTAFINVPANNIVSLKFTK
jgi:O-glycosyl hydrolase